MFANKKLLVTVIVLIIVIGAVVGWLLTEGKRYFAPGTDARSQGALEKIAVEFNKSLPMMVDKETELITTSAVDGTFVYNYKLVNFTIEQIQPLRFLAAIRSPLIGKACSTTETTDAFLKKGVTLRYSYVDKDERPVGTIDVKPSDCGF